MTEDHRAALDGLDRPSLLAVAPGGPFDAAYEEMARRIPGVQVVRFDGAGHALFVDQADRFNEVLETFLARR
jgi:microsomal epoxide hydrolase